MARLRNNGNNCSNFKRLAQDFKIPKNHGRSNKQSVRDYKREVEYFMNFMNILIAGGALLSPCGAFLVSKTGAFYTKVVLFKNKKDKKSDTSICESPIWGNHGTTPRTAAKDLRHYIKQREKMNFQITTSDFKITHKSFPVSALFCEQNAHCEKGEFISHAYAVILKRNISKDRHREGYNIIQKDSVNKMTPYKYVQSFSKKIKSKKILMFGADHHNIEIAENAECLQQAYFDCARAMDGVF